MRTTLERLFDRYRRRGDLAALARVFDRTARDLLGLAQHLARDPHDAEDLVQATFVTAIDRASSWDRGRPLRPWLSGILAHQAANLIRARRRHLDRAPALGEAAQDPAERAVAAELQGELESALGRLSGRYREVLEPYLVGGERPEAIARRLGRAPGTVRTQIHRGLERLRRLLPAGVGAGLALSGTVRAGRGLDGVRAAVLGHAGAAAGVGVGVGVAALSIPAGIAIGGWIVGKKLLALGAGAAVASVGLWLGNGGAPEAVAPPPLASATAPQGGSAALAPVTEEALPDAPRAGAARGDEPQAARTAVRHGRAVVHGRVLGVEPEHLADVELGVRRGAAPDGLLALGDERIAWGRAADARFDAARQHLVFERLLTPTVSGSSRLAPLAGRIEGLGANLYAGGEELELEGSPGVQPDGTFELDLTRFLLGDEPGESRPFVVRAGHEVYFEAMAEALFDADARTRLEAGDELTAEVELRLEPAAVLRGRVVRQEEASTIVEPTQTLTDENGWVAFTESRTLLLTQTLQFAAIAVEGATVTSESGELVPGTISISFHTSSGIEVALFREGAEEPLARTQAGLDGSFEFKVPEEGPFVLVAVTGERPAATRRLDLVLREARELEEALELVPGPRLAGVVEDFGAFPAGGLELEAVRLPLADDVPIRWSHHSLTWSAGEVVRRAVQVRTEEGGVFTFLGLAPGPHRVRLAPTGAATLFTDAERDAAAVQVAAPADDVQVVLPLAVLEVAATVPLGWEEGDLTLAIVEPGSGRTLATAGLDGEGRGEVVTRPGVPLRLALSGPGLVFPVWEGAAPAAGERLLVERAGAYAPDDDADDGGGER